MEAERIALVKSWLWNTWNTTKDWSAWELHDYINELEQRVDFHDDVKAAFQEAADSLLAQNKVLQERADAMSAYLKTHDHTLHDAAMQSAKGE